MTTADLALTDPEAAAFFADARAALTDPQQHPETEKVGKPALPEGWPMTPEYSGPTITVPELHAMRGHATRFSFDWAGGRRAMWVGQEFGGWTINDGQLGGPASMVTTRYDWAETVRLFNEYLRPGRLFGGPNMTVDEWLPQFTPVCLAHGDSCSEADDGHHFVEKRTLPLYPAGAYRPCGGGHHDHDGAYRYRFQVESRWRLRYGCRSHHEALLKQYQVEADGAVSVLDLDDHLRPPA